MACHPQAESGEEIPPHGDLWWWRVIGEPVDVGDKKQRSSVALSSPRRELGSEQAGSEASVTGDRRGTLGSTLPALITVMTAEVVPTQPDF